MNTILHPSAIGLIAAIVLGAPMLDAQLTTFTYQGQLTDGAQAANGSYDFQFGLASAATGPLASISPNPITVQPVAVTDGIFTVEIDFGASAFLGTERWLEISVRPAGSSDPYITLSPRQPIHASPYATYAANVDASGLIGQVSDANLSTSLSTARTFSNPGNVFFGDGSNLTSLNAAALSGQVPPTALANAWQLGGNAGISAGTNFLGTTDGQALDFRTNNSRALRLESAGGSLVNVIGGFASNTSASAMATIGGGGSAGAANTIGGSSNASTISGGLSNNIAVGSAESTIGGGSANQISDDVARGVIGGGRLNLIGTDADNTTIAGGRENTVAENAATSVISGGTLNRINPSAAGGTIAGGSGNTIAADVFSATIGGGSNNTAGGLSGSFPAGVGAVVAGGEDNEAIGNRAVVSGGLNNSTIGAAAVVAGGSTNQASGTLSSIGGGTDNQTTGRFATVPGGELNRAGADHSFAAGHRAKANHPGSFVWSDSSEETDFTSLGPFEFAVKATNGARFLTDDQGLRLNDNSIVASNRTTGVFGEADGFDFNPGTKQGLLIEQGLEESAGLFLDGDSITMWSPADNNRLVSFIDEDGMAERAYIDGSGNLHTNTNLSANGNVSAGADLVAAGGLTFTEEGLADTARITFLDNFKYIETTVENDAMRFQAGRFGFNRFPSISGSAATLQLDGSASKTTAGSWLAHSDQRIKTDIETIPGTEALDALRQVRPVSFRYHADYRSGHQGIADHEYVNVIAQEFAEVFPDWVSDSGEAFAGESETLLQVDTYPLTLYSVSAIQELEQQLQTQKSEVRGLRAENEDLRSRLERLEQLVGSRLVKTQ